MTRRRIASRPRSPWERIALPFRRLRQEPGTVDTRRHAALADRAAAFAVSLRPLDDARLVDRRPGAEGGMLRRDDALARLLGWTAEHARRRLGLDPRREQLLAAACMLRGLVVDMATGEGKTLVGHLVAAVHALAGRRVHVLSANDFLAARDAAEGLPLFEALGLRGAAVAERMPHAERQAAYRADIVHATIHAVGFDLLRDRQRTDPEDRLVPEPDVAVIDELDAVLLDDATVPLVLAGEADAAEEEETLTSIIAGLRPEIDYTLDGERRNAGFTDAGIARLEEALDVEDLYAEDRAELMSAAHVALHARAVLERDVHYVVRDGRLRLVSDARGRTADRRRWPDGLHAAVERKEGLEVTVRAEILDQVLVESVVRGYRSITGMSGTALEAAERLADDLQLKTAVVPAHRPCIREDEPDRLFAGIRERDDAAAERVLEAARADRPVLVGTASVAESERFADRLRAAGVHPAVLNAKNDAEEAETIARAGRLGAVTVSTQMAGRGVDIRLGPGAADAGGLLVLGLGRYESARLDHQLRGRAGRQGDPGSSVFFTAFEDPVVREHLVLDRRTEIPAEGPIESPELRALYDHAQRVAEGRRMQLHRTTRDYHRAADEHRALLLDTRERVLREDEALDRYLRGLWPADPGRAERWRDRRGFARQVVLHHLDRGWSRHVNRLADVREGIHLRALGRQNPLEEFSLIAVESFRGIASAAAAASRADLERAAEQDLDLEGLGLRRPASTWTYLITDNPFGTEADRVLAFVGRVVRGGRPPRISYTA
ncbi:accessory Sec system translocase SecA2 [Gulosibacter sp. 10]|uniref:accessory Sec system translocase SecA2 n=1 Tax=Gulosibacter sp. 10 TaxID=1255570 RepID=UPI00097F49F7|nr:accessory Sec system translocase SecA2 [Gulosibacter sp. 10]SJM53749.1 Protein export cytoplasm protein SecA ATPase RNA helicase (TC 3.A.5.1.1) [Gulosibacter sp. 10]